MNTNLKLKTIALIFSSFFFATLSMAQVGIRGGVTITNQEFKNGNLDHDPESKFGADLALVTDFPLGDGSVSIAPELHWVQKGYKISDIDGQIGDFTSTFNYLELPVLLKLNFGSEETKFFVMAGPSFGYLLGDKTVDANDDAVIIFGDDYAPIEVAGQLGAGVGFGPVRFDVRYFLGFTNVAKDYPDDIEVFNKGYGAGISLMF